MRKSLELTATEVIDQLIEKFSMQVRVKNAHQLISSGNAKDFQMLKNSLVKFVSDKYKKPFTYLSVL